MNKFSSEQKNLTKTQILTLKILTMDKVVFCGFIININFRDSFGKIMIQKDYAPVIGLVISSLVEIYTYEKQHLTYLVSDGFYKVYDNKLFLVCDFCILNNKQAKDALVNIRRKNITILQRNNINNLQFSFDVDEISKKLAYAK